MRYTKEQLERQIVIETIHNLLAFTKDTDVVLGHLIDVVCEHDPRLMDELQEILHQQRSANSG
jgi:hypothetical protein